VRSRAWTWVFLVETEDNGPLGWVEVEPDHVDQLLFEVPDRCSDLKVSTFQGLRLWSCQMRATVSLPTPKRLAIRRVVQCVEPSSGDSKRVSWTTAATVPSGSQDLRPRPGAIRPTPSTPSPRNVGARPGPTRWWCDSVEPPRWCPHRRQPARGPWPGPPCDVRASSSAPWSRARLAARGHGQWRCDHRVHRATLAIQAISATDGESLGSSSTR
jgi:hypothetical protein